MKMVIAMIRPEQLPAVKQALFDAGIRRLTAMPVQGTAPVAEQQHYRGVQREVSLFHRMRLEVAVNDADLETAITAICEGGRSTGGFGKIFVLDLHETVTIWNGERGARTL